MNGATKLKTWKLFNLIADASSPLAFRLKRRSKKAAVKRASVINETIFQNVKARQVTKQSSV